MATTSVLKDGCYYLRFTPKEHDPEVLYYEGTIRVLHVDACGEPKPEGEIKAGGDLYCHPRELYWEISGKAITVAKNVEPPSQGIPIFPRRNYRFYLQIVKVLEGDGQQNKENKENKDFTARFRVNVFDSQTNWPIPGMRTIAMTRVDPPGDSTYPTPPEWDGKPLYFRGAALNQDTGDEVGTVSMGWVSPHLRRTSIIIDQVEGVTGPTDKTQWEKAFNLVGWDVQVFPRRVEVTGLQATDGKWTISELHNALLQAKAQPRKLAKGKKVKVALQYELPPTGGDLDDPLLDNEWCFHLLCVQLIDGFERGVMYDIGAGDSNHIPREGAAIACGWPFPTKDKDGEEEEKKWGSLGAHNKKLENVPEASFRVAVHEIGHAMGLDHNFKDCGFMCTSDTIAGRGFDLFTGFSTNAKAASEKADFAFAVEDLATSQSNALSAIHRAAVTAEEQDKAAAAIGQVKAAAVTAQAQAKAAQSESAKFEGNAKESLFPANILPSFHRDDRDRLRFGADVAVRPGTSYEQAGPLFGDSATINGQLELNVLPHLDAVPLGAPVRVNLRLTNTSDDAQPAPQTVDFNSGLVCGKVIDPNGKERSFWPLKKCFDKEPILQLQPTESVMGSLTLWRGAQGPLFPIAGRHRIVVRLVWDKNGKRVFHEESVDVSITPPANDGHSVAALKVLSTPDVLLSIALGGTHLKEGNEAVDTAMGNDVLKPHYMMTRYKLTAMTPPTRAIIDPLDKACGELNPSAVLSYSEIEKIISQLEKYKASGPLTANMRTTVALLAKKILQLSVYAGADVKSCRVLQERLSQLVR